LNIRVTWVTSVPGVTSGPDPVERDTRGILEPWLLRQGVRLTRYPAGPALAGLVDRLARRCRRC